MKIENTSSNVNSFPNYANFFNQFIHPIIVLFGIAGNIWILFTLIFGRVKISKTTNFYYLILGFSDLCIVTNTFVWGDICDGLWLWTNGKFYFCFDSLSDLSCIIMNLWYYLSEIISNYSLVALSIERLIAVCYPLRAKSILTREFTFYLLIFLLAPFLLLYSLLIPFSSRIIPYIETGTFVCHIDYNSIFGKIFNFSMPIIVLGLHTIIDFIISFVLFFKLYLSRRNSDLISKDQKMSKELIATLVLLMLCMCTMVIYGLTFICYIGTAIFDYFPIVSEQVSDHAHVLRHMFLSLTALPHSNNILIYLALIPSFRHSAFCKLYKEKTTTTRSTIKSDQ